jgi:hypothetical protein
MPNGFQGSQQEWDRLEAPLRRIDAELLAFAGRHGLALTKNLHGWPERSLAWIEGVERTIQVLLRDAATLTYNVWIAAREDRPDGRYWKRGVVAAELPEAELHAQLAELLERGHATLSAWAVEDLERAGQ